MPGPDGPDRRELVLAGLLIAVAVAIVALALRIPPGVQTDPLGPRAFPLAVPKKVRSLRRLRALLAGDGRRSPIRRGRRRRGRASASPGRPPARTRPG